MSKTALELRNYLPCGWVVKPTASGLHLLAPSQQSAEQFLELSITELIWSANRLSTSIEIAWKGCKTPLRVSPRMAVEHSNLGQNRVKPYKSKQVPMTPIVLSRFDFDWNAIHSGDHPIYITQLHDQHNLYLNRAAVIAQSDKPPAEFLSATAHSLNFEDELLTRCQYLQQAGHLLEYTYEALRWFRDPDTGLLVRRRMQFVSNFYRVMYLGQDCWLGEVLQANPLERFVDSR